MSMSLTESVLRANLNPVFLETGTGEGGGVELADRCGFRHLVTIDNHAPSLAAACKRVPRVVCHQADSPAVLGAIIDNIEPRLPITFWLDAHTHFPGQPPRSTVFEELAIIHARPWRRGSVILIDDWSWFGAERGMAEPGVMVANPWASAGCKWQLVAAIAPFIVDGFTVNWLPNRHGRLDILQLKERA